MVTGTSSVSGHYNCCNKILWLGQAGGVFNDRLFSLVVMEAGVPRSRYQQIQGPSS